MKSIDIYIFDVERKLVSNMSEAPIHRSEEAVHRCSTKKAFLKISQNSRKALVPESLFKKIKKLGPDPSCLHKKSVINISFSRRSVKSARFKDISIS